MSTHNGLPVFSRADNPSRLPIRFFVSLGLIAVTSSAGGQQLQQLCVEDDTGKPLAGVAVVRNGENASAATGPDGCVLIRPSAEGVSLHLSGYADQTSSAVESTVRVMLQRIVVAETVSVTTDRGMPGVLDPSTSVATLSADAMESQPSLGLDDRLHQVAGFQLFRRTSSWTANPTSQGVSLRGLGSTAASRSLVVSDQVPLNDAFGGWIHWQEIPNLAVERVSLLRGGSSDLYGSSAIGGVVDVVPVTSSGARPLRLLLNSSGGSLGSTLNDALIAGGGRWLSGLAAASILRTNGYTPIAPELRGPVDSAYNVHSQSGRTELAGGRQSAAWFLRGNLLNETRQNGTLLQTNGTRLWRYVGGGDLRSASSSASLRLFGDRETYRQSFSAIAQNRGSERLTRFQRAPVDELGYSAQAYHAFPKAVFAAIGSDLRDVRATDDETPVVSGQQGVTVSISARQRAVGGYGSAVFSAGKLSVAASVRLDSFTTHSARQVTATGAASVLSGRSELLASPHLGLSWTPGRVLPRGLTVTGTAFRAFRGPTPNELYRTGQVGQQTTLPNSQLFAERATGFEAGGNFSRGTTVQMRAVYFWTEVNRPVSALLTGQNGTTQTLQRQNLGQIRSRGTMLEFRAEIRRNLETSVGYQFAVATVTRYTAIAGGYDLLGNWIPQVPRQALTGTVDVRWARLFNLHLTGSYTGQQFDDAENQFRLRPYPRFDLQADRSLPWGLRVYAGAQNLLDRRIEAGRTPTLTLAAPRMVLVGLRYGFAR